MFGEEIIKGYASDILKNPKYALTYTVYGLDYVAGKTLSATLTVSSNGAMGSKTIEYVVAE